MSDTRESVRVADWLATRTPQPPAALSSQLIEAVGDTSCKRSALAATLVEMAGKILPLIGNDRESATRLLVADALITYAMEAAADHCDDLEQSALATAQLISRVVGTSAR